MTKGGWRRVKKATMRSYKLRISPRWDVPIRVRPWFLLFTAILMILLGLLGFTNVAHSFPLNDKILHFVCFFGATGVFYFIFDCEEDARRIWFWRHAGLICTFVLCFFFGGILSEVVQSMLPYKTFQIGDIYANLLGSSCGLFLSYHLERYYRHRREISRLYTPLDVPESDSDDDDPNATLPLYNQMPSSPMISTPPIAEPPKRERRAYANVWDSREDVIFSLGDDEDEEEQRKVSTPR